MAEIKITKKEDTRFNAHIVTTVEETQKAEKEVQKKINQKKKFDGFRKGKAPLHIIKSKATGEFNHEVLNSIVYSILPDIDKISEQKFYDIVSIDTFELGKQVELDLVYDCFPYFEVGKPKDAIIKEHVCVIKDENIQDEIKAVQKQFADTKPKDEDGFAEEGDLLIVDYEVWVDDVPNGEPVKGQQFYLGEGILDENLEKEIIAKKTKVNQEFTHKIEPKDKKSKDEKKQNIEMIITIREILEVTLPEVNEELFKKYNEKFTTLDEMKEDITKNLTRRFKNKNYDEEIGQAVDVIIANTTFFISETFRKHRYEDFLKAKQISNDSLSDEEIKKINEFVDSDIKKEIYMQEIYKEARKNETKSYSESFKEFVKEEFGENIAQQIGQLYDFMQKDKKSGEVFKQHVDPYLMEFNLKILFNYFTELGIVKKGKKYKYSEFMKQESK